MITSGVPRRWSAGGWRMIAAPGAYPRGAIVPRSPFVRVLLGGVVAALALTVVPAANAEPVTRKCANPLDIACQLNCLPPRHVYC